MSNEDVLRHRPGPDASERWQESLFLAWFDPVHDAGGGHHISLSPTHGTARAWSWVVVEGELVSRVTECALPLPDANLDDLRLGALRVATMGGGRRLTLESITRDCALALTLTPVTPRVELSLNVGGARLAERHYETMGFATGSVDVRGSRIPLSAAVWHDHSWGEREYAYNPRGNWLYAVFGDDLAISLFVFDTSQGINEFGWVWDDGAVHQIDWAEVVVAVDDDGLTPRSCTARCWTVTGRFYEVDGTVSASALNGGGRWFAMDGLSTFRCGSRRGAGFLEVKDLGALTDPIRAELGLDL